MYKETCWYQRKMSNYLNYFCKCVQLVQSHYCKNVTRLIFIHSYRVSQKNGFKSLRVDILHKNGHILIVSFYKSSVWFWPFSVKIIEQSDLKFLRYTESKWDMWKAVCTDSRCETLNYYHVHSAWNQRPGIDNSSYIYFFNFIHWVRNEGIE